MLPGVVTRAAEGHHVDDLGEHLSREYLKTVSAFDKFYLPGRGPNQTRQWRKVLPHHTTKRCQSESNHLFRDENITVNSKLTFMVVILGCLNLGMKGSDDPVGQN